MTARHPLISWSQRRDTISLSVGVLDAVNVAINTTAAPGAAEGAQSLVLSMASSSGEKEVYMCALRLFGPIEPGLSTQEVKPRGVDITLVKKAGQETWFWPRLTAEKTKNANITINWALWKDEDDLQGGGGGGGGVGAAGRPNFDGVPDGDDCGGLSLDHSEIQSTLSALRAAQLDAKREAATKALASGSPAESKRAAAELKDAEFEAQLFGQVPKFGFAKDVVPLEDPADDDDDAAGDSDDLPPLV